MNTKVNLRLSYFFSIALLTLSINLHAQNIVIPQDSLKSDNYTYKKIDDYKTFLNNNTKKNAEQLEKKLQPQYTKLVVEKNNELINDLKNKYFLFDSTVYPYLYSIFCQVLEKNSLDKSLFHFFVSRSTEVNAYTYEDGTIVCDLGLLNYIENESQLTMVFCHELGHYLLKHPSASIINYLQKINSPEFLKEIKEIKKQGYNTKTQLEDLLMADVFNSRKHNRLQESAADSLGMILFSKTSFNGQSVPRLFDLLDSSQRSNSVCKIHDFFNNEEIAVDETWFKTAKKMSFGGPVKKEIIDSLKTHPDCAKRKIAAELFFEKNPKPGIDFSPSNSKILFNVKNIALFDEATFEKNDDNLGYYLYLLIQNDKTFPFNNYIKTEIFNTWLSICNHQKDHTFYTVVSKPYIAEDDKDEYDRLLKILDIIDLRKLIEITSAYYDKNKNFITLNNQSITNLNQLKKMLL